VIERLMVSEPEGGWHEFDWAAVASNAWWGEDGKLSIGGESFPVSHLEVEPPPLQEQVEADITDIAPTVAASLGLPSPARGTGQALKAPPARYVLLLFLDGFGYVRYAEAHDAGLILNLAALGEPLIGLTFYPPSTNVATAALLTGAPPQVNGVDQRGIRKTEVETLFDVANAAGRQVVAVEGESLAFNLRNSKTQLSGDRDGNGSTDDNVLANALAVLDEGMPDLFYVHFHGIDDAGHTYGPNAPEEEAVIHQVDMAVGQLLAALPADTLIIIFADHGMHRVEEEGRLGNHGNLIERDMFIPIFVAAK
jgi:predicted AlkP superfamily pyrophosphatase or phosphodiesterase